MTPHRVRYTPEAEGRIRKLHPEVTQEIRDVIRILKGSPLTGHSLQQELFCYRSYRVRSYPIIYRLNDDERTIDAIFIRQRRNVYEELLPLVRSPSFGN